MITIAFRRSLLGCIISCFFFASWIVAADSSTSVGSSTQEHPGSLPVLISLEHVSKDLHLRSLQRSVIAGLRNDYRVAAMKITEAGHKESPEAAQKQLDHLTAMYNERVLAILNPRQRRRLREIERQVLGGTLLTAPSEQQWLKLTEDQKKKIAAIDQDSKKRAAVINGNAEQGKLRYHRQIIALRKNRLQHAHAMLAVLTPAQRAALKKEQGAPLLLS